MLAAVGSSGAAHSRSRPADSAVPTLESLSIRRNAITRTGMYVLGGWAVANLAGGGIGYLADPARADFHLFNAGWNLVNLGLAASGLIGVRSPAVSASLGGEIRAQHRVEKTFLVNLGLNVAYMTAGAFMAFGPFDDQRTAQFGVSLILQGGFLFAFDLSMAIAHGRNRDYERLFPVESD